MQERKLLFDFKYSVKRRKKKTNRNLYLLYFTQSTSHVFQVISYCISSSDHKFYDFRCLISLFIYKQISMYNQTTDP